MNLFIRLSGMMFALQLIEIGKWNPCAFDDLLDYFRLSSAYKSTQTYNNLGLGWLSLSFLNVPLTSGPAAYYRENQVTFRTDRI